MAAYGQDFLRSASNYLGEDNWKKFKDTFTKTPDSKDQCLETILDVINEQVQDGSKLGYSHYKPQELADQLNKEAEVIYNFLLNNYKKADLYILDKTPAADDMKKYKTKSGSDCYFYDQNKKEIWFLPLLGNDAQRMTLEDKLGSFANLLKQHPLDKDNKISLLPSEIHLITDNARMVTLTDAGNKKQQTQQINEGLKAKVIAKSKEPTPESLSPLDRALKKAEKLLESKKGVKINQHDTAVDMAPPKMRR